MIRLGAVGDVVRTLPSAAGLRAAYPHAELTWLVERASASLVEGQPWVDETLVFPREELRSALRGARAGTAVAQVRRFARLLRSRRFDLVVDFHAILKSGLLSLLTGAGCRVSFAPPYGRELAWLFANRRARLTPRTASRFERNEALLRFLGVSAPLPERPLSIPPEAEARMQVALEARMRVALENGAGRPGRRGGNGAGAGRGFVAIHPGTRDATPHKRYTLEGYAAVARELVGRAGLRPLVTCGPARSDAEFADAIVAASAGAAERAPATPSLLDLAALFARCRLYVGSDTGPLHLASLVGTPVVQLLGPTEPVENAPHPGTRSRTVRVQVGCNPCRRGCAAATCMRVIPSAAVLEAASALLATAPETLPAETPDGARTTPAAGFLAAPPPR